MLGAASDRRREDEVDWSEQSDEALLRALENDPSALGPLYDRHVFAPDHPRHRRAARGERAGGDARVFGVTAGDRVERARVLGSFALGTSPEAMRLCVA